MPERYDVAVIGAGPAGLAAGVSAADGLRTVVIDAYGAGGSAAATPVIRNYPGFAEGVSGDQLMRRMYEQAQRLGTSFALTNPAVGLSTGVGGLVVALADGVTISARAAVIATGVAYRTLGVPSVDKLTGTGVIYADSVAEPATFAGQEVFIAGASAAAGQAALDLAKHAANVTMVVRAGALDANVSAALATAIDHTRNIRVRVNTQVVEAFGEGRLEGVRLRHRVSGTVEAARTRALIIMMGADPNTEWLKGTMLRDEDGYLVTGNQLLRDGRLPQGWMSERAPLMLETGVPGVFAAGDVRRGAVKRVTSAILEGMLAITLTRQVLREHAESIVGAAS
ncbi:MAG TPA: NAD(P)/FAD-dependent oxidoreductase [Candidatus Dormibacteraeota bacterium]|nr:NAD(P)/FAD-dependent oxidoreductase [Candidatus Dormibacteraeota bacterium]